MNRPSLIRALRPSIQTALILAISLFFAPAPTYGATCPLTPEKPYRTPLDNTVYLVTSECTKRPFFNPDVYLSHFASWSEVIFVEQPDLDAIPRDPLNFVPWGPLRTFKNGSLVKLTSNPSVYLLEDKKAYILASESAFASFGYSFDQIEDITQKTLDQFAIQSALLSTGKDAPPSLVFKYSNNPDVFILKQESSKLIKVRLKSMSEVNAVSRGDRIATLAGDIIFADPENTNIKPISDSIPPEVISIRLGTSPSSTSLTVPVSEFTATDNIDVTGYLLTEATSTPSVSNPNWKTSAPTSYTFTATGTKTLYAWVKDAIGNVSAPKTASITIVNSGTDLTPPTISSVSITPIAAGITVTWNTNEAANSVVSYGSSTAYDLRSTSSTLSTAHRMTVRDLNPGSTYHVVVISTDESGNTRTSAEYTVTPKLDTTPPVITAFTIPASSTSMVLPITITATDDVGVTGYIFTKTTTVPLANSPDWTSSPPANYDFARGGSVSVYAWAKDAAGNISISRIASSVITPGIVYPVVSNINATPSGTTLTITWTTDLPTSSIVSYGVNAGYGTQVADSSRISAHSAIITGLTSGTTYHYSISATTAAGAKFETQDASVTMP